MKANVMRQVVIGLGVVSLVMLPACGKKGADAVWWHAEQERIELSHRLELRRFQLEHLEPAMGFPEAAKLIKSAAGLEVRVEDLRRQRSELANEVVALAARVETTRLAAIREQRARAVGKTFDEFRTPSGRTFTAASVAGIDDAGVTLRHANGSARLRFADLSAEQRELFGLDQGSANAAENREKSDALAYERWIDSQLAVAREKDKVQAKADELEDLKERQLLAVKAAAAESSRQDSRFPARPASNTARIEAARVSRIIIMLLRPSVIPDTALAVPAAPVTAGIPGR